jgi:transposase
MELQPMSQAELTRLEAMVSLRSRTLTQVQIAVRLGISERQVRRLWARFERDGPSGVVSRRRGKASNHQLDPELVDRALDLVRTRYADFGPTFANEKLREIHGVQIGTETLRQAMIRRNLWIAKKKRYKIPHPPRERRPQFGELIQIDGSPHDWFEKRARRCTLIVFIDDATSKLINLRFVPAETTWAYLTTLRAAIEEYGRPFAIYSDKHSIFRAPNGLNTIAQTQFGRALEELDIELICANSPQAKGRVERANRTLQRRLIRELRLRNICSIDDANAFLPLFRADHNRRFAQAPQSDIDAHRDIVGFDLEAILAIRGRKRLSKDRTIQLHRDVYFVHDQRAYNYQYVTVIEHEDGTFELRDEDDKRPLVFRRLRSLNEHAQIRTAKDLNDHLDGRLIGKKTYTPPPTHPWRIPIHVPESPR